MSDLKQYKTKCLRVDLVSNKNNFVIKKFGASRQKSLDKNIVKTRMIPLFPIRIGSSVNSNDSDECVKIDLNSKGEASSIDEGKPMDYSQNNSSKTRRDTTELSLSSNNSSSLSKKINFMEPKSTFLRVSMQ